MIKTQNSKLHKNSRGVKAHLGSAFSFFAWCLKLGICLSLGIWNLVLPSEAQAQEFSLSLSPPLLEIMLQPGKSITQAYEVKNLGDSVLYLKSFISPFAPDPESGQIVYQSLLSPGQQPEFKLNNANLSLNDTFVLQPNESQQLVLKVSTPQNLPENDYYFTFFVSHSSPGELLKKTGSSFQAQIGSHLLLTVSQAGEFDFNGQIARFEALPKITDLGEKINFDLIVANGGQALFKANGKIEIFDWLGKKKKEIILRPDNVLVNSQRKIVCLDEPCSFSSFWPGHYRAVITVFDLSRSIYFWILPTKLALALTIGLIVLKLVLDKRKKNGKHIIYNNMP